jgi:hypothetical protein
MNKAYEIGSETAPDFMAATSIAGLKYPLTVNLTNQMVSPIFLRDVRIKGCASRDNKCKVTFDSAAKLSSAVKNMTALAILNRTEKAILMEIEFPEAEAEAAAEATAEAAAEAAAAAAAAAEAAAEATAEAEAAKTTAKRKSTKGES